METAAQADGNDNSSNNGSNWAVQLLNFPPNIVMHHLHHPLVGRMRRVSLRYFSIESSFVDRGGNDGWGGGDSNNNDNWQWPNNNLSSLFTSPISVTGTITTRMMRGDGGGAGGGMFNNFLLHDMLMGVLPFLEGGFLASISEAAGRPNIKCFHFLELQLQRTLLTWERARRKSRQGSGRGRKAVVAASLPLPPPTFDGSIAGTGAVSCLEMLDGPAERGVVGGYLNSNALVQAMPLHHSLMYFRQMLLLGHHHHAGGRAMVPHLPENIPGVARNAATAMTGGHERRLHGQWQQGGGGEQMHCGQRPQACEVPVGNDNNRGDASKGAMTKGS
jgi:hypothetical protein